MTAPAHLHAIDGEAGKDANSVERPAKFIASQYGEIIANAEPYAVGGAQIYTYVNGCYQPGERLLQQRILDLLDTDWTKRRADEITTFIRITARDLWPRPPLNVVNVRNGLLNVTTRELAPHTPEHLSPIQLPANYDPLADCPTITAFYASTAPDLTPILDELAGYLIVPDNRLQRAVMLLGPGGTGKSTQLRLFEALLGEHNVACVALHRLEDDRFAAAELYGRLANIFADLDARALRASSIFKSVTGGDKIPGERKYRDPFEFRPYARLVFSANEPPPTADHSDAFFDRWLILPFTRKHRGTEHVDHNLLPKLTTPAELSGLLNRALDGLTRLRAQHDFTRVASSTHAAERFRIDADSAAGFITERCELQPEARIARPALYAAYREWCEDNNRHPLGAQRFNARLRELHRDQIDEAASKGRDYWLHITLREEGDT